MSNIPTRLGKILALVYADITKITPTENPFGSMRVELIYALANFTATMPPELWEKFTAPRNCPRLDCPSCVLIDSITAALAEYRDAMPHSQQTKCE